MTRPVGDRTTAFPRNRRLLTGRDYDRVFKEGRKFTRPSFVVYIAQRPPEHEQISRCGLTISRKYGKAVRRNRWRRRIREIFRVNQPRLLVAHDLVFVARNTKEEPTFVQLVLDFEMALKRLGLLPTDPDEPPPGTAP